MAFGLTIETANPSPQPNGSPVVTGSGGFVPIGTYSVAIFSDLHPYGSLGDYDWWGGDRSARVAHAWDGIVVGSNNSKIAFPFTPPLRPVNGTYAPDYPRRYLLFAQTAATFDFANAATLVGIFTDRTATTLTLDGALGTDTYMLGETATTYKYQQLYRLTATERNGLVVTHDGYVAPATQLTVSDVEEIQILWPGGAMKTAAGASGEEHSAANWLKKLRNSMGRIHVLVTDALPGTAETDPYTNQYYGKVKSTNYRNSQGKDSEREFLTGIAVYHTVATSRVPVGDTDVP